MSFSKLEVRSVGYLRDRVTLLSPVSLDLSSPGITVIVGPNGAGKSLFLQLLHGLLTPTGGTIRWSGQSVEATRARRGYLFQKCPVMRRSVRDNVAFPLLVAGTPRAGRAGKVAAALEMARLSGKPDVPAAALSGGEQQRMALARALVTDPDVVLMDEPSASLDPASTRALEGIMREVSQRGVKVLMATHDLGQARRLAEDVLVFHDGALVEYSPAARFFDTPASPEARDYVAGVL